MAGAAYAIKHTTRSARSIVEEVRYRIDVNTLHRDETRGQLGLNDIGRVRLRTTAPLIFDEYRRNRTTGSFILIDETTSGTVGAGMIIEAHVDGGEPERPRSPGTAAGWPAGAAGRCSVSAAPPCG